MAGRIYIKNHTFTIDEVYGLRNGGGGFNDIDNSSLLRVNNLNNGGINCIITDGKASDGGLRLRVSDNTIAENATTRGDNTGLITFPIGFIPDGSTTVINRPAQMKVKDFADTGYVRINVVSGELQTSDLSGGEIIQHYWRVRHDSFDNVPNVALRFYYRNQAGQTGRDLPSGTINQTDYVPGYVLDGGTYDRYFESDPDEDKTDIATSTYTNNGQGDTRIITFNGISIGGEFSQAGFAGFPLTAANYTAGEKARFVGAPEIYYTRLQDSDNWYNGYWQDNNNWSLVPHDGATNNSARPAAGAYPEAGDIAVIGYGGGSGFTSNKHSININNNNTVDVAEIRFDNPVSNDSRLVVRRSATLTFGKVSGTGGTFMQRFRNTDTPTITGDFGEFNSSNTFTYAYYLDADGTYNITPPTTVFPNLRVEGGSNRIAIFQEDITVNNNFTIDGRTTVRTSNGADGDILVKETIRIGGYRGGTFEFNDAQERTVEVGAISLRCDGDCGGRTSNIRIANSNQNSLNHRLIVNGDINQSQDGDFDLVGGTGGTADNKVVLELAGLGDHSYTQTAGNDPSFYQIVMNKGSDTTNAFTFPINFSIPTATATFQPVEVLNGTLILDNASIDITLADGGNSFSLPNTDNTKASSGSGGLELRQGVARINGDDTGIVLDGLLRISGGELRYGRCYEQWQ